MAAKTGISGLDRLRKQMDDAKKNVVKDVLEKNERFVEENSHARRQAAFDRYQIGLLEKENAHLMEKINCSTPEDLEALIQFRVNQAVKRKLSHVGAVIQRTVSALNSCMEQLNSIASDVDMKAKELERNEERELNRISEFRGKPMKVLLEKRARKEAVAFLPSVLESPMCRDTDVENDNDDVWSGEGGTLAELGGDPDVDPILTVSDAVRDCLSSASAALLTSSSPDQENEDVLSTTVTFRARTKRRKPTPERSIPLSLGEEKLNDETKPKKSTSKTPSEEKEMTQLDVQKPKKLKTSPEGLPPVRSAKKMPQKSKTPPERFEDQLSLGEEKRNGETQSKKSKSKTPSEEKEVVQLSEQKPKKSKTPPEGLPPLLSVEKRPQPHPEQPVLIDDADEWITPPEPIEHQRVVRERSATPMEGGRKRRTAATKIGSFKEPSLITKMRRSK